MERKMENHSGRKNPLTSERELAHAALARKLAAEGMVLLKNEDVLPLSLSVPTALFGSGAGRTVKGGTGSGDVNSRENISVYQGLQEAGMRIVNEEWLRDYNRRYEAARERWKEKILQEAEHVENPFDAYAANPFVIPEGRAITEEDIVGAEAVVYVLSRISGEGRDRRLEAGDYCLSKREWEDLFYLNGTNLPIILLLNTGGPVELTDLPESVENVKAILHISQPGQEGGRAAADVLLGKVTPGGKLTATWAKRYADYPCGESYSYLNGDLKKELYKEGIYVGYRYFDSFGVTPLYPFGYGLSYTSFAVTFAELRLKENGMEADVVVENTGGCHAGREVVQVYLALPQTGEARECRRLAGFEKTRLLQPGERQKLTVFIEQKQLAGFSEQKRAWIIKKGLYSLWIGTDSVSLEMAAVIRITEEAVLEHTHKIYPGQTEFTEYGVTEIARVKEREWHRLAGERKIPECIFVPGQEERKPSLTPSAAEGEVMELLPLLYGNIVEGGSTLGSSGCRVPGSAGETTEALEESCGIDSLIMADGPAGLRLRQSYEVDRETDTVYGVGVLGSLENGFLETAKHHENTEIYYQYCTAFPVGTALAQTWDRDLLREFGEAVAVEMEEFHVDLWLAPGMNIQRNPLCGRNFEYYSEDPYLSGTMAATVTKGVQSHRGCGVTIKHFVCNNQEDNRMEVDACVSEKALREIYLRAFEIAVKESGPAAVMSSYNLINGVHAANSKALCTTVLREEWGFDGVVMSDWNTTCPADGSVSWMCAAAGNDIIMPGNHEDARNIREACREGKLTEADVRSCAGRVLALVRRLKG